MQTTNKPTFKPVKPVIAKIDPIVLWFTPFAILCLLGLTGYFLRKTFKDVYPDVLYLLPATAAFITIIVLVVKVVRAKSFEIHENSLVIKDFYGKKCFEGAFKTVSYSVKILEESKNNNKEEISLITPKGIFKISGLLNANVDKTSQRIKEVLKELEVDKRLTEYHKKRKNYVEIIIGASILLLFFIVGYLSYSKVIEEKDIVNVKVTLAHNLKVEKLNKGGISISAELVEYPDFIFKIDDDLIQEGLLDRLKRNDTLEIQLLKKDYEAKLAKTTEPLFWDKIWNYRDINMVGLKKRYNTYFTYNDSNNVNTTTSSILLGCIVLSVFAIGSLLYKFDELEKPVKK